MILLLDIGNTAIKWAVKEPGITGCSGRFRHQGDDLKLLAQSAWRDLQVPDKIVASNVAGANIADTLSEWALEHWGIKPVFVHATGKAFGVTNAYSRPADLGVDRWAALIGAQVFASGPLCIVDCGTAVTIDYMAVGGDHRGGIILPGVAVLERMLLDNTAELKPSKQPQIVALLARGAGDALHSGAVYMVTATIDRIVADLGDAEGICPEVVITGGDAGQIQSLLSCKTLHDPDLVLKGLAILAGEY